MVSTIPYQTVIHFSVFGIHSFVLHKKGIPSGCPQTINKVPPHGGNFFKEVKKTKRKKEMNVE